MPFDEIFHGLRELVQHFGEHIHTVADNSDHLQSASDHHEHIQNAVQHFSGDDAQSGDHLTSSSYIDPNQQYVVNGQTVSGSQLKEGAGGVYSADSFNTANPSDAISKTDIKKA